MKMNSTHCCPGAEGGVETALSRQMSLQNEQKTSSPRFDPPLNSHDHRRSRSSYTRIVAGLASRRHGSVMRSLLRFRPSTQAMRVVHSRRISSTTNRCFIASSAAASAATAASSAAATKGSSRSRRVASYLKSGAVRAASAASSSSASLRARSAALLHLRRSNLGATRFYTRNATPGATGQQQRSSSSSSTNGAAPPRGSFSCRDRFCLSQERVLVLFFRSCSQYADRLCPASCAARLRKRLAETPMSTVWYPLPISLGIVVLVVVNFYKQRSWESREPAATGEDAKQQRTASVAIEGPWQVRQSPLREDFDRFSSSKEM